MNKTDIINEIKAKMIEATDFNSEISQSNHLVKKQVDYKLDTTYQMPIELKIFSASKTDLTIAEFLIYAGEILRMDYADILFGKYNSISNEELKVILAESSMAQIRTQISQIGSKMKILTINETKASQSIAISSSEQYYLIIENWQI